MLTHAHTRVCTHQWERWQLGKFEEAHASRPVPDAYLDSRGTKRRPFLVPYRTPTLVSTRTQYPVQKKASANATRSVQKLPAQYKSASTDAGMALPAPVVDPKRKAEPQVLGTGLGCVCPVLAVRSGLAKGPRTEHAYLAYVCNRRARLAIAPSPLLLAL
eukprot:2195401-Rhodomonas_salina.1